MMIRAWLLAYISVSVFFNCQYMKIKKNNDEMGETPFDYVMGFEVAEFALRKSFRSFSKGNICLSQNNNQLFRAVRHTIHE